LLLYFRRPGASVCKGLLFLVYSFNASPHPHLWELSLLNLGKVNPNLLLLFHFIPVRLDVRDVAYRRQEFLRTWSESAENAGEEAIARFVTENVGWCRSPWTLS